MNRSMIIVSLLLFFAVYNPPIVKGLSFTMLAVVVSAIYCVFQIGFVEKILQSKTMKKFEVFLFLFMAWGILICTINSFDYGISALINTMKGMSYYVCAVMVALAISIYFIKNNFGLADMMNAFIGTGIIQSVISIVCLLVPDIKAFLNDWVVEHSNSAHLVWAFAKNSYRRNYGFASSLFDIFGCTMSLIAVLTLTMAIKKNSIRYLIYFGMISLAAIINARTSIVLIGIGSIIIFFSVHKLNAKAIVYYLFIIFAAVIALYFGLTKLMSSKTETSSWLKDGLNEIFSLFSGKKIGYFDILFNEFFFFPNYFIDTLLGTGVLPNQIVGRGSDAGYVQNIWQFGIIGSILVYAAYFSLLKRSIYYSRREYPGLGGRY